MWIQLLVEIEDVVSRNRNFFPSVSIIRQSLAVLPRINFFELHVCMIQCFRDTLHCHWLATAEVQRKRKKEKKKEWYKNQKNAVFVL